MKHSVIVVFLFFLITSIDVYGGKRLTVNGVQYESSEDNTATATLTVQAKGKVTVLESVEIGKKRYLVVQVNEAYFKKNNKVTGVVLPKSIKIIKSGAFRNCTELVHLSLPNNGGYTIEDKAFAGCENITDIDGNLSPFFVYRSECEDNESVSNISKPEVPKFSSFAENALKDRMKLWQIKKNYETVEQYRSRVTEENRLKRMHEFEEDLKNEYVALYKPNSISTSLDYYDSEYGVFTIPTIFYGELYVLVPKEDAQNFRANYSKVDVLPEFGVKNDTLAIMSCQFKLGDKVYQTTTNYAGQGGADYKFELPPLDINLAAAEDSRKALGPAIDNEVDKNIPKNKQDNKYTFALIIGNEKYENESQVPYANNDAKIFAEYCKKTLGIPNENVQIYTNAGLNRMRYGVTSLVNTLKAYDGEAKAIVYYAGHGIPDESSKMPYLLPTDGFAKNIKTGYSMTEFYDELASAPSQMTLVFLDACFSGAKRDGQMLAEARGVAIKARNTIPNGNLMVFSASQGDETAYSDKKHGHGMFTYYLLKHLQTTKGNTSIGELSDFVITNVKRTSVIENDGKLQTPSMIPSLNMMNSWKEVKLR